jgi:small subunit ribosomal protein S16
MLGRGFSEVKESVALSRAKRREGRFETAKRLPAGVFDCRVRVKHATMVWFRRTCLVLTIRLSRIGKKKKPFYRVVVIESSKARNGRIVEAVGTYDPLKKPAEIKLDAERVKHWIGAGAQPSDTVRSFIRLQKIA